MPLYDYAPRSGKCAKCHGRFEVTQRISDRKLSKCPECGKPVERLLGTVSVHTRFAMSKSRLNDLGMTKYVKTSDGTYERTAGHRGPKTIRKNEN